jgi:hypothetical protein
MHLAYIDPGSGALVWQLTVAALMGALFYLSKVRTWIWKGLTSLFRSGKTPAEEYLPKDANKD